MNPIRYRCDEEPGPCTKPHMVLRCDRCSRNTCDGDCAPDGVDRRRWRLEDHDLAHTIQKPRVRYAWPNT